MISGRLPEQPQLISRIANPFSAYAAGFSLAIWIYSLGYSDLYPPLQLPLIAFLFVTIIISLVFSTYLSKKPLQPFCAVESKALHTSIFIFLTAIFFVEVIYNGGLPLALIATAADFNYRDFGIPVLHVAFVGSYYFYAAYWFDLFIQRRGRIYLLFTLVAISTALLMVNRGALIITILALVFVYIQRRGISRAMIFLMAALLAGILWGFGALGDLRTHGASGESIILRIGDASDKFLSSPIPTELFWPYLYVSSPLANLQLNVTDRISADSPGLFCILELLPDFISKRLVDEQVIQSHFPILITNQLTVATMYGRSFLLLGWLGVCLSFLYFLAVCLFAIYRLYRSRYFVATCGILSSLGFIQIFDNMFVSAGGILQVLMPVLLAIFERKSLPVKVAENVADG